MVYETTTQNPTHFTNNMPYKLNSKTLNNNSPPTTDADPLNVLMQSQENLSTLKEPQHSVDIFSRCNKQSMIALLENTKFPLTQENGQRRYGPPPNWTDFPPNRGCEVFLGKIPRDCFEDELVPLCEKVGKIYEIRLMMDFK
jgi:hypothetical protein